MTVYEDRLIVPFELLSWNIVEQNYTPPDFTSIVVITTGIEQGWADPEGFTQVDFETRISYEGAVQFGNNGRPLNPKGRTGLAGRSLQAKWGVKPSG